MTVHQPVPSPTGRGTLRHQLTIRVTALVALVTIGLGILTTVATFQINMAQLDQRLDSVAGRQITPRREGGMGQQGIDRIGQPVGTLVMERIGNTVIMQGVIAESTPQSGAVASSLPTSALTTLANLPATNQRLTLELGELGRYRLSVFTFESTVGTVVVVVGLPISEAVRALDSMVVLEAVLAALTIGVAYLVTRRVVTNSLRPLNRLATTATAVSTMELHRGQVNVPRVPPTDSSPTSEVGQVGQAFNHMLNNVESALVAREASETKVRQFVADASHELRNPLAAIRGYAELTRRGRAELPEDTAHALSRIDAEADRMSALVEDLLLLARLDAGRDLHIAPTDVSEILVNAVSDARVSGPDHHWRLAVPAVPMLAAGDAARLHQVFVNLLANARVHTPAGTEVTAEVSEERDWVIVRVTDNGPGIPPEILPNIFERFTRAEVSRFRQAGSQSTGLGLAIVAAVVSAHRGSTDVFSVPGRTTFTVRLPRYQPAR